MRTAKRPPGYHRAMVGQAKRYATTNRTVTPGAELAGQGLYETIVIIVQGVRNERWDKARVEAAINKMHGLEVLIREELDGSRANGYLLHLEVRRNPQTTAANPRNDIVRPVGVGHDPIDALATDMRIAHTRLSEGAARGTRYDWRRSRFLWVSAQGGTLRVTVYDDTRAMYEAARALAKGTVARWKLGMHERLRRAEEQRRQWERRAQWERRGQRRAGSEIDEQTSVRVWMSRLLVIKTMALNEAETRILDAEEAERRAAALNARAELWELGARSATQLATFSVQSAGALGKTPGTKALETEILQLREEIEVMQKELSRPKQIVVPTPRIEYLD